MPDSIQKLISRLSLRQLQVFQAVHKLQGYSKAADLLGLTQPAVSAQIRQLESALGQKLFEYVGRTLYSTPVGEMVAKSVDVMFNQIKHLQNDIHDLEGRVSGSIRLVVVNTAQYVVPYLIRPFVDQYPEVKLSVQVVNRAQAIERLEKNNDDLTIMGLVPAGRPLNSLPFLDNELLPLAPKGHPLLKKVSVEPQEFLDARLLSREEGSGSRLALKNHCQQHQLRYEPFIDLSSNEAIKHGILAGLGVAILPRMSVLAELKNGSIKTLPLEGFPLRRSWCLVYPAAKSLSPVSRRFVDYVQQNLRVISQQNQDLLKL